MVFASYLRLSDSCRRASRPGRHRTFCAISSQRQLSECIVTVAAAEEPPVRFYPTGSLLRRLFRRGVGGGRGRRSAGLVARVRRPPRQVARDALPRRRRAQWRAGASRDGHWRAAARRGRAFRRSAGGGTGSGPRRPLPPQPRPHGPRAPCWATAWPGPWVGVSRRIPPPPRWGWDPHPRDRNPTTTGTATCSACICRQSRAAWCGHADTRAQGGSATLRGRFTLDTSCLTAFSRTLQLLQRWRSEARSQVKELFEVLQLRELPFILRHTQRTLPITAPTPASEQAANLMQVRSDVSGRAWTSGQWGNPDG